MATIGLDKLFYSKITEGENGDETYAAPVALAKAMTAELSVELAEATLYADDGAAEVVKEFQSGTLTLGVDDIGKSVAEDLTGAVIDENGVLISASEDGGAPVAIGFRAKKANGKYRYFWLYRVIFGIPATNLTTKGESIELESNEDYWGGAPAIKHVTWKIIPEGSSSIREGDSVILISRDLRILDLNDIYEDEGAFPVQGGSNEH